MKNSLLISAIIVITAVVWIAIYTSDGLFGGTSSVRAQKCTVTHTTATLGNQLSTTVLAAYSNRAWAVIEQPKNASNTVSVNFGGTAVAGSGYTLLATSSTPVFGLNSDFAYTGAVDAITDTGSTTVLVTECRY